MTMPIAPQHHFTLINGIRTHYVTAGEQHAQTVVLLAGFPESWYAAPCYPFAGRALSCHRPGLTRTG